MNTAFLNTQAVEAWDAWFRWRERGQLRDLTIEATWKRIAGYLTANAPATGRAEYSHRLIDAFTRWSLLLDARILATAGTANPFWQGEDLVAVLNVAAFVRSPGQTHASLDFASVEDTAALAVYALDDAAMVGAPRQRGGDPSANVDTDCRLRVGLVGLADALASLGAAYDSEDGRRQARLVAQSLANGCLAGCIALARDRGARATCGDQWKQQALQRSYPLELVEGANRYGLRYSALTSITSQPRLATFANNVADAVDPLPIDAAAQLRGSVTSRRVAGNAAGGNGNSLAMESDEPGTSVPAQLRMRAALQPWIDERICYPATLAGQPDIAAVNEWNGLSEKFNLGSLTLRPAQGKSQGGTQPDQPSR